MRRAGVRSSGIALGTLFFARAVYAFNWYDIGAVLPLVRRGWGTGSTELVIVLAVFLLGTGIFQLPAAFVAMRLGNRSTAITGLAVMATFTLASAVSPNWIFLAATRFGAGAGAAFFFAPALGLATSYYPAGTRGPVIGIFNAGFSLGSGISLIAGALVGLAIGWHWALALGGFLLVAGTAAAVLLLPRVSNEGSPSRVGDLWRASVPVLRSRPLWALALGTSGLWAAFYVAAQAFPLYASQAHPVWGLALIDAIPTAMIFAEIPGGPIGGWIGERRGELRWTLVLWGTLTGAIIVTVPYFSLDQSWAAFLLLGFADGAVFAVLYLIPTYLPRIGRSEFALALALLNSIQIFVGSGFAVVFALVAQRAGYFDAWLLTATFAVSLLPLLAWVPRSRGSAAHPGGAAD
ncbi:MAG: MFS transporter [Thermoplasmata archaeon]